MQGIQQFLGGSFQQGYNPSPYNPQQVRGLSPQQVSGPQAQFLTQTTDWMSQFLTMFMQFMPLIMMVAMMGAVAGGVA